MYVIVQWGGVRVLCLWMSPTSMSFVATHFCTAGWHTAWVNRKKVGSKDRREDEMSLTSVTAYKVSMHDKCHYVIYGRTVTVPSLHFR